MACNCDVCVHYREFIERLQHVPKEHQEYFDNLYSLLTEAIDDANYYKAIVKNEYPNADEILARYRRDK